MNNKIIIAFGFRRISELFRPRSALSDLNADLGLNNSEYPAQPHPVILNYFLVLGYPGEILALVAHISHLNRCSDLLISGVSSMLTASNIM